MNQRGVLLTLMVFFVGIVAVTLAINSAVVQKQRESTFPQKTSEASVSDQFEQGYYTIQNLYTSGQAARDKSRGFLFKYDFNANSITVSQALPIPSTGFDRFNELLNIYPIFWNKWVDNNFLQSNFSFFALQNSLWGGSSRFPVYEYKILPQCIVYRLDYNQNNIDPLRILAIEKGRLLFNQCIFERQLLLDGNPDYLKNAFAVRQIIVDLYSNSAPISGPTCTGTLNQQNGTCWKRPFDSTNAWPFIRFNFFAGNDKNFSVYNHIDPSLSSKISFRIGASTDQNALFGGKELFKLDLSGLSSTIITHAEVKLIFSDPPQEFLLNNYSLLVEQKGFNVRRLSQLGAVESFCGDFDCNMNIGENFSTCSGDCTCGNQVCNPWENPTTCPGDCTTTDGICSTGETGSDCGCGNGFCDQNEFYASCSPNHCTWCGNKSCDSGETAPNCPGDCNASISCTDECGPSGTTRCIDNQSYQVCSNTDGDVCFEWGLGSTCPLGHICLNGICTMQDETES